MKKKLLVMLVAVMCIMLCACGSSEGNNSNTENNQSNSESNTEEQGFSIVGEWKIKSTDSPITFNEDGTFTSYLGDGFKYEDKSESNIITLELDGLGFSGVGMVDFDIIEENGNYKLVSKNIVIIPAN